MLHLFKICVLSVMFMSFAVAESKEKHIEKSTKKKTQATSVTVYVDATLGLRKRGSASKLNKSHKKYAAKGYRLVDVETYIENGDLEGFFVSYVKIDD